MFLGAVCARPLTHPPRLVDVEALGPDRRNDLPPGGNTRISLLSEGNPAWERDRIGKTIAAPFEVTDFEATCAALEKKGVAFKSPPKRQAWGWWAEVIDSEGNVLGLHGEG